jgi:LacI family transcriptional regulator
MIMKNGEPRRKLTINDIATKAGISRSTVSRVLSGHPNVNEKTRSRVRSVMEELNFIPNRLAQGLVTGKINVVGLVVGDIRNPYFSEITRAVEEVLNAQGYLVVLCDSAYNPQKEVDFLNVSRELGFASLIMTSAMDNEVLVGHLSKLACPVVLLNRYLKSFRTDVVSFDNYQGAYLAAEHVIKLGHRDFKVLLGPAQSSSTIDRERGYRRAFADHDIACDENAFSYGDLHFDTGYQFGLDLLKKRNRPTAVLAGNDMMAIGVIKAWVDKGFKVPDDLSVIGFDDIPMAGMSAVPLTTIRQPQVEMGRQAAQVVLDRLHGNTALPRRIIFDAELVVRGSTQRIRTEAEGNN